MAGVLSAADEQVGRVQQVATTRAAATACPLFASPLSAGVRTMRHL
jgi:hypothetical protein